MSQQMTAPQNRFADWPTDSLAIRLTQTHGLGYEVHEMLSVVAERLLKLHRLESAVSAPRPMEGSETDDAIIAEAANWLRESGGKHLPCTVATAEEMADAILRLRASRVDREARDIWRLFAYAAASALEGYAEFEDPDGLAGIIGEMRG